MSAQIIAALRKRADMLEDEAIRVRLRGERPVSEQHPYPRGAGNLAMLAAEFRKLAVYADGLDPDGYAKVRGTAPVAAHELAEHGEET